jgi:dTDP-4-dehydrorhamnose 3,5-epimerase
MRFTGTAIRDAFIVEPELIEDERGFFSRLWSEEEFAKQGLTPRVVQCNTSFNKRRGTLRGMHYQVSPHEEAKLVRCIKGAIYDVIVDLRTDSESFHKWIAVELTAQNRRMLFIPAGCAHGFQTLEDDTEVTYQMSEYYHPESACGLRWNDPALGIDWPLEVTVISQRDKEYSLL